MALFGMAVMLGPAFGPTLGGYIVDHASWPWIFFINLPVGALGLFMVYRFVHEPEDLRLANLAAKEQTKNHQQGRCVPMSVGSAEFAPKRRTQHRSPGEQRHHGTAGIARRREPGLSSTQGARIGRAYGKCRLNDDTP